jgi:arylsulfatase A-like enzyme
MLDSISWDAIKVHAQTDEALAQRIHDLQHRPPEELFNLAQDPWEQTNLAEEPAFAANLTKIRGQLQKVMESHGDPLAGQ